ncbi:MAG TPA: SPOR domain-containing protein, partial [Steroidobacteraceae bacterium]|nr:SPOR domain-containing protein [Steroidobacteraceae bacterium]
METRLKERLVGAIALVTIVVIVVPELLTGPRPPPMPTPAVGAAPVRTVTIDLAVPERGAISHAPFPAAAPAAPRTATPPTASPSTGPSDATATPVGAAATTPAASGAASAPASVSTATGTEAAVAEQAARPSAAPATEVAPPRPAAAAHGTTGWVVQLGSFAARGNAERLATGLRTKGYAAFVAEFR